MTKPNFVRALLGDFSGNVVGEKEIMPDELSWRLNEVGRVKFNVGIDDDDLHAGLLDFGRTLLLQFDNGLPDWGGVLDPPRRWGGGSVTITAYSAEYLLGWRYTGKSRYFNGVSPGAIFQDLIVEGNAVEETGVALGDVYTGGDSHSPEYHLDQVLGAIQKSVTGRLSDYEFAVLPTLTAGSISFAAHLYQRRGSDLEAALVEGTNIANITLDEQGPIINDITIAGADTANLSTDEDGDGWGDERITASALDQESINRWRRRQHSNIFSDVSIQSTLDGHADRLLVEGKDPYNRWSMDHVNKAPCSFADLRIGDTVYLQAPSYGIGGTDTRVRLLGRSYSPADGLCQLLVEEHYG